ncbi:DUF7931 domain-containing protein [Luteimonas sp. RIT-PG2_3]
MEEMAGPRRVVDHAQALEASLTVVAGARRQVWIRSAALDPGLFDSPAFIEAMRGFATGRPGREVWILLHDAASVERAQAPLLALAQRLPSIFTLREVVEAGDRGDTSACIVNDAGDYYRRPLSQRLEGEAGSDLRARAQRLIAAFAPVWERSRPCTEFRALGL